MFWRCGGGRASAAHLEGRRRFVVGRLHAPPRGPDRRSSAALPAGTSPRASAWAMACSTRSGATWSRTQSTSVRSGVVGEQSGCPKRRRHPLSGVAMVFLMRRSATSVHCARGSAWQASRWMPLRTSGAPAQRRTSRRTGTQGRTFPCLFPAKSSGYSEELAGCSGHSSIIRFALRRSGFRWRAVCRRVVTHDSHSTFESPTPRIEPRKPKDLRGFFFGQVPARTPYPHTFRQANPLISAGFRVSEPAFAGATCYS